MYLLFMYVVRMHMYMYIHVYLGSKEASATIGSTGGIGATSCGTGGGKQIANTKTCELCVCVGYIWIASVFVIRLTALAFYDKPSMYCGIIILSMCT